MKRMPTKKEGLLRPHIKPEFAFLTSCYFKSLICKKVCNSGSYKNLMSETLKIQTHVSSPYRADNFPALGSYGLHCVLLGSLH